MVDEIRGKRTPRWLVATSTLATLLFLVAIVVLRQWLSLVTWLLWASYCIALWSRGGVRVTAAMVHLPALLPSKRRVSWEQVEAVDRPGPLGNDSVTLRLKGGRPLPLTGIPAARSGEVAALGGKELRKPPISSTPIASVKKEEPRRPTDAEVERDLRKREAALAEEGKRLNAELESIRRRRARE